MANGQLIAISGHSSWLAIRLVQTKKRQSRNWVLRPSSSVS